MQMPSWRIYPIHIIRIILAGIILRLVRRTAITRVMIAPLIFAAHLYFCSRYIAMKLEKNMIDNNVQLSFSEIRVIFKSPFCILNYKLNNFYTFFYCRNSILRAHKSAQMTSYTLASIEFWSPVVKDDCLMSTVITGADTSSASVALIKIKCRKKNCVSLKHISFLMIGHDL